MGNATHVCLGLYMLEKRVLESILFKVKQLQCIVKDH